MAIGEARADSIGPQHVQFDWPRTGPVGGSSPSEGLAGPCIERVSNNCEYVRTVALRSVPFGKYCRSSPLVFSFKSVAKGCAVRRSDSADLPGHLCSLVPGQRAAKLRWQCRDRPGDGIDSAPAFFTRGTVPLRGRCSSIVNRVVLPCQSEVADLPKPMIRSPSQCQTARSAASADRSLSGVTKDLPRRRLRARGRAVPFPCEGRRSAHDGVRRGPDVERLIDFA